MADRSRARKIGVKSTVFLIRNAGRLTIGLLQLAIFAGLFAQFALD